MPWSPSSASVPLGSQIAGAQATTNLTLIANPNTAAFGTPVTFNATLGGGSAPTGTISMGAYTDPSCNDFSFSLGVDNNVNAGNGTYALGTVTPAVGTYYGSAFYAGDGSNSSSSSGSCQPILVVSSRQHHVHSCTLIVNLGPYFLELILTDGPDSPIALFFDNIAPCITP